jgi:DNA (cytosine-5)-methyltransferase 1
VTALIDRVGFDVDAIDVFCGYGGSSQGIHAAGATVKAAANHSALAIECHAANFPNVEHWQCDMVDANDPHVIDRRGKKVRGKYLDPCDLPRARFAWFSPGCTHHSQANATKQYQHGRQHALPGFGDEFDGVAYAKSERSRVTMSCVLRYAAQHRPEIVVVENVVEVCHWGPGRDGSTFAWWMRELVNLGYDVEPLFLNSQFFPPCPQSRDRIYIVAWRKGNTRPDLDYRPRAYCTSDTCGGALVDAVQSWKPRTSAWPLDRWGKHGQQYDYRCPDCSMRLDPAAWPAYTAIDWSNLGATIGERSRPLAPATRERARRAVTKFRGSPPVIIPAKSTWGVDRPVFAPFTTQTSQQDKALVSMIVKHNGSIEEAKYRGQHIGLPFGAITMHPAQSLLSDGAVLPAAGNVHERAGQTRARAVTQPVFTQHATQAFALAHLPTMVTMRGGGSRTSAEFVTDPFGTVSAGGGRGGNHCGLVSPALFAKFNGGPGDTAWHHVHDPLNTITGRDSTGLLVLPWVDEWRHDPDRVTAELAQVMAELRGALASIDTDHLVEISDDELDAVRFRMLDPDPELRRAMAFGDDYVLLGNKGQMTSGLGNAVTPPVASWITERCLATLR